MRAHVLLHVRDAPDGPVVVTPVQFPALAYEAATVASAIDALRPQLAEQLRRLEPLDRLAFAAVPKASLSRVPVAVPRKGKDAEPLEIVVGMVVLERVMRGRPYVVAYVPAVRQIGSLGGRDNDVEQVIARLTKSLGKSMKSWSTAIVLNVDEPDTTRLEVVEVEVAEGAQVFRDVDDDEEGEKGILETIGVDLTQRAGGRLDGREELVDRVLATLAVAERSSVLLVGAGDVGKTALVDEVARRIARGEAPAALHGRRVWRVTANELIAGATYTGQWQERIRQLIDQARRTRAVVVMGDPVGIIDAGRWARSDNNFSRFLRPYVESGEITIVCEATPAQFAAAVRQEPNFVAALQRIDVDEPADDVTRFIVSAASTRLAESASVEIEPDAIDAAVTLTGRFEPYRSFPGKAIRLLEDAVRGRQSDTKTLGRAELTAAFARRSGMPLTLLSDSMPLRIADVRTHFETRILGQPDATAAMVDIVSVLKAGLNDPQKALGSFFFVGPTGVGKTETAKALAEFLFGSRERLVRFDMGEYTSGDAVQRLIGTAWGSAEGELTRRVREQPFCVVLLDEIEKAHSSVFDALLAAIGEGRLTDASGRTADFRNAIVIMTSNLGATRVRSSPLGFGADGAGASDHERYIEAAERFFRPEFFNRIDRVVVFHPLSRQTVRQIARRELNRLLLREGIVRRRLLVELDDSVVASVAESGFHPRYGARPLQRAIERRVIEPLARLLVERRPDDDSGFVRVHVIGGSVAVDYARAKEPEPSTTRQERRAAEDDASFARAERQVKDFAEQLTDDEASALAADVRSIVSELVASTHERAFWDDAVRARTTLQRIYQLEQALDRFDVLLDRVDGLTELARRVRETQNRARLTEIRGACEEMGDELVVLRLELAAAAAGGESVAAVVRVIPVGKATVWADRLLAMYAAWAERTARETVRDPERPALTISGPATLDLLRGETGLHRHVGPEDREQLARVLVQGPSPADEPDEGDGSVVVRVYEEGKRRGVRDPRTGVRESHLVQVLDEGRIDAFLLAVLRETEPAV